MRSIHWEKWANHISVEGNASVPNEEGEETQTGMVVTQFGAFTFDPNYINKSFTFYIGHANFPITEADVQAVAAVPGVESLDVFSRYRFRVGLGQHPAFAPKQVLASIEAVLCGGTKAISQLTAKFKQEYQYWAVYQLPNGEIQSICSKTYDPKFEEKKRLFVEAKNKIGGTLISHDSE